MTEEACCTRSQKRPMDWGPGEDDADSKRAKMERSLPPAAADGSAEGGARGAPEPGAGPAPGLPADEEPVDMCTSSSDGRPERRAPSPDVIVLSDSEQPSSPRVNGLPKEVVDTSTEALMKSSPQERERMVKRLKEELRLEEAKLVLLKKLRQSQMQKEPPPQKPAGSSGNTVTTPPPLVRGTQNIPSSKPSLQTTSARVPGSVIPPPLVRGGQQVASKLGAQASSQVVMPPLVRGAQQIHNIRQHSGTGPPPLLLAPRAAVPSVQIQGQRIIQQGLIRVASVPSTSLLVNIPQANSSPSSVSSSTESPASRQAAAKLALRKQLEKTLLEIPPPKPPAPEMNFLPSAANNEFIYLVGLEEVVQSLLETQAGRVPAPVARSRDPFVCAQCKTDFTCRWREEQGGAVMCESCMASSQKKALKAEHTSRLKAAFVKALQQEQEIEQRLLQAGAPVQPKSEPAAPHPALKQVIKPRRKLAFRSGEARDWSNGAVLQASSQLSRGSATTPRAVLHTFSQSPKLQSAASATTLVSRTGRHSDRAVGTGKGSAGTWKKAPLSTGGALAFVSPSLAAHKSTSAVDRQREYLLDMIPPRSIPQSATWK